jgi:hypothetical protein
MTINANILYISRIWLHEEILSSTFPSKPVGCDYLRLPTREKPRRVRLQKKATFERNRFSTCHYSPISDLNCGTLGLYRQREQASTLRGRHESLLRSSSTLQETAIT